MTIDIKDIAEAVKKMDCCLRKKFSEGSSDTSQKAKLWENTYICHQIEKREKGEEPFTINDHILGMVYSMLSSNASWERIGKSIDPLTGRIKLIDDIFGDYDSDELLHRIPEDLRDRIKEVKCASQSTRKQMEGLHSNIQKLKSLEEENSSLDAYYQSLISEDTDASKYKTLILTLSRPKSANKMIQMGEALTAEYLRNIRYDMSKPDRHICRILGSEIFGCSEKETVSAFEACAIVHEIAEKLNWHSAKVDYVLWAYSAKGYGAVCRKRKPDCDGCDVKEYLQQLFKEKVGCWGFLRCPLITGMRSLQPGGK